MLTTTMRIKWKSPILMHNPTAMSTRKKDSERMGKKIPSPYDEAKASLYVAPNNQLYIGPDAFREAALIAAKDIRDPTRKGRANMERRFASSVFLSTQYCLLERPDGSPITSKDEDWDIDTRRAVVQKQGILRSRAKVSNWECDLEFEYDEDLINPELILAIVHQSGIYPGVLDYRVGKKGMFGRFKAEMITNQKEKKDDKKHKSIKARH